jgi:ABC-type uncharacterized transport system permease subunit
VETLFAQLLTTAFLATFIRSVVPLLLTGLGGLFSERSGVVNIALDGLIIFGALAGAVATLVLEPTFGALAPWLGWVAGAVVGGLIAWIHAVVSIKYRADQVISGTAGVFLSIGNLDSYVRNISAGLGFISLAALIFGQWKPLGVLGATLLFGFLQALSITLGGTDLLPPTLVTALPYLITIVALIFTGRSAAPRALGKPYDG